MNPLRILMIGHGNVGKRLIHLLSDERPEYPGLNNLLCIFNGIVTKHHGYIIDSDGLDPLAIDERLNDNNISVPDDKIIQLVSESDYDVLVELSTLSIERKGEPAVTFVKTALQRGKHVVTANKGPAAFAFKEIESLARKNQSRFLCESAVMDGTPIFSLARAGLKGTRIQSISGILNTTTNYVLSKMEEGISIGEALKYAQEQGFAEADPSYDLEGWDAAAKIAVLANVMMDGSITPISVKRKGITNLDAKAVRKALQKNKHYKLICRAERSGSQIAATVQPELIDSAHPFASVNGTDSILKIETDLMGPVIIRQENPTLNDTAYGVLNDLLTVSRE